MERGMDKHLPPHSFPEVRQTPARPGRSSADLIGSMRYLSVGRLRCELWAFLVSGHGGTWRLPDQAQVESTRTATGKTIGCWWCFMPSNDVFASNPRVALEHSGEISKVVEGYRTNRIIDGLRLHLLRHALAFNTDSTEFLGKHCGWWRHYVSDMSSARQLHFFRVQTSRSD